MLSLAELSKLFKQIAEEQGGNKTQVDWHIGHLRATDWVDRTSSRLNPKATWAEVKGDLVKLLQTFADSGVTLPQDVRDAVAYYRQCDVRPPEA